LLAAVGNDQLAVRDHCILEVLAATGLRVSELVRLRVSQLFVQGEVVETLHLEKSSTKRNHGGKLPLSKRCRGVIASYVRWLRSWYEGDWLFPGYEGNHLSSRSVQLRIKHLREQAGLLKKITPHSMRKFYIQRLVDQNLDIRTVQELSRHANLESLHAYLVVNEAAAAAAVEELL
jgi:site-specific recombinase XerD